MQVSFRNRYWKGSKQCSKLTRWTSFSSPLVGCVGIKFAKNSVECFHLSKLTLKVERRLLIPNFNFSYRNSEDNGPERCLKRLDLVPGRWNPFK